MRKENNNNNNKKIGHFNGGCSGAIGKIFYCAASFLIGVA